MIILRASEAEYRSIAHDFEGIAPGIKLVPQDEFSLLGAPIAVEAIGQAIDSKVQALDQLRSNLASLGTHEGLFLLKNCLLLPRLMYLLCTVPTWKCKEALRKFDSMQKRTLETNLNVQLDERAWLQATLPVR